MFFLKVIISLVSVLLAGFIVWMGHTGVDRQALSKVLSLPVALATGCLLILGVVIVMIRRGRRKTRPIKIQNQVPLIVHLKVADKS